jgi:hypothetical protein
MSDDRKTLLWPWIVALLIGLPLLYVVSFGPACWLVSRDALPRLRTARLYRPLVRIVITDTLPVSGILRWYSGLLDQEIPFCESFGVHTSTVLEMNMWLSDDDRRQQECQSFELSIFDEVADEAR